MLLTLDDRQTLDPAIGGAKAAWLAKGRQAGLAVLPGVVVPAAVSRSFIAAGCEQLERHNSGRARMTITSSELDGALAIELERATAGFSVPMVVRSSSLLEGSGEWSGAFTSYLDVHRGEAPKAVLGCYASMFTQHALERFNAAGISPQRAGMAVLVQPALDPDFGGTARVTGDGVVVTAVKGSPAPLVQGWEPGVQARVAGEAVRGEEALQLMGERRLRAVAGALTDARDMVGANSCEWAMAADEVWLLQLHKLVETAPSGRLAIPDPLTTDLAARLGRLIRRYPGPLGEQLVLPWAIGDPELAAVDAQPARLDPAESLHHATAQGQALAAEVWGLPKPDAAATAAKCLRDLRGPDPGPALAVIARLTPPDRARAEDALAALATVRTSLVEIGAVTHPGLAGHVDAGTARQLLTGKREPRLRGRIGFDRWDPFNAAVVAAHGAMVSGTSASHGIAFGRMCIVPEPARAEGFRPRDVVVGIYPEPGLGALLFDASALITTGGGPAAHLFESARALAIPALAATRIEDLVGSSLEHITTDWGLAVDGANGVVYGLPW